MRLFDTHCHISDEAFDEDRAEVIERMHQAGIEHALVIADASGGIEKTFDLVSQHDFLDGALGVHPQDADKWTEDIGRKIETVIRENPRCKALGEIGLDYHYETSPREKQKEVFDRQLDMAYRLDVPVILHIREAHGDAADIIRAHVKAGTMPEGVMHCYTGSKESAKEYLAAGLYISFTGAVTFKNAPKLTEVVAFLPEDRILVETDCPYMAPVPMRGKRNEPAFVRYTLEKIAEIRGADPEEMAEKTCANGYRLFRIQNGI